MSTSSNIFDHESPGNLIEEEEKVPLDDEEFSTNSIRVLLVDADSNSLNRMQNLLTKFSYQVATYCNGEEAIGFLKKSKHEIDLVIWDYHMPQINGLDALNTITKEINLPVVIMSNDNKKETVMKSITCGACDFLRKPLSQEVIEVLWRHVFRERMMLDSGLVKPEKLDTDEPDTDESDHNDQDSCLNNGQGHEEGSKVKKPRLTWTPELHRDFEVAYKVQYRRSKAIPMEILKYMKEVLHVTQRLTRSNVASHLQKYRQNLSKKIPTDPDLEETLEDFGSRNARPTAGPNAGPSTRPKFWANAGASSGPSARPTAGPTFWANAGASSGPTAGPSTRPNSGPTFWDAGPSDAHGASNLFLNSNVNLYEGGRYVLNDRAVMNAPVQYASTTYQPMINDPVITNSLLEQYQQLQQQQQYNLQLPTVQAQQEPQRVSSDLENPVQLIYNSTLPDDHTEYLRVLNSHFDQTPRND